MNETPTILTLEPTTPSTRRRRGRKILPPAFTITVRIAMLVREPGTELPPLVRTPQGVYPRSSASIRGRSRPGDRDRWLASVAARRYISAGWTTA